MKEHRNFVIEEMKPLTVENSEASKLCEQVNPPYQIHNLRIFI